MSDALVALSLVLLFIEIIKATRTSRREILNHALSTLILLGAGAEFIAVKGFGTSTFFLITLMCLFDVVAGYTVSIVVGQARCGGGCAPEASQINGSKKPFGREKT